MIGFVSVIVVSDEHRKASGHPGVLCINIRTMKMMRGRKRLINGVMAWKLVVMRSKT